MLGPLMDAMRGVVTDLGKASIGAISDAAKAVAGDAQVTTTPA